MGGQCGLKCPQSNHPQFGLRPFKELQDVQILVKDKVGKGPGWSSVIDVGDLAPHIVKSNCVGRIARSVYEAAERISLRLDDLAHDLDGVRRRWERKRPHLFQGDDVAAKSEWPVDVACRRTQKSRQVAQ